MKKSIVSTLWVVATMSFGSQVRAQLPSTLGWYQIPNTAFQSVQQTVWPNAGDPSMVMAAWGGGAYDSKRNRMIIWGGGHGDYSGNEVYVLDLNANPIAPLRLNNPDIYVQNGVCHSPYQPGSTNPSSRHTYGGLAYLPTQDKMVDFGGGEVDSGCFGTDVWWFDPGTLGWTLKLPSSSGIPICDYDRNKDIVHCFSNGDAVLDDYDPAANTFVAQSPFNGGYPDLDMHGALDYDGKRFYVVGGGYMGYYDVSGAPPYPDRVTLSLPSCLAFMSGHYPGVQYDPVQKLLVEWHGGDTVNTYNPATNTCGSQTYPGGPGAQQANGTFGRFRYVASMGVFILCNSWAQNCYALRLTNGAPPPAPVITSAGSATGTVGSAFSYQITATNSPTSFNATGLPAGLSVNTNTGLISGTPTAAATSSVNLSATNAGGTGNATLTLTINPSTPDTTPPSVPTGLSATAASSTQINLSWNASTDPDSPVAGYKVLRCQGLGCSPSAQIATNASTSFQDTGLSAGTTYAYAVSAYDAAGNTSAQSASASATTLPSGGTTPDADFAARCAAAGVLNCQGFDDAATFTSVVSEGALTDGFGTASHPNLTRDTTIFLSGGSSANFFIPAGAGENDTGNWWSFFGQGANNRIFGQNSTFYVQYAFRADSTWTATDWTQFGPTGANTAPKLSIFHNVVAGSCAEEEITVHNHDAKDLPTIYTECGGRQAITQIDGMTYSEFGPGGLYFQQGWIVTPPGYQCEYNNGSYSGPNCFHFTANQWYTLYFKIHIGTWGSSNSSIEAWVAPYGQPMLKWINTFNYIMQTENLCDASGTGQGNLPCPGYNVLQLTQFMTGKIAGTGPAAHVWYDELIVSAQPIAQPGGSAPPTDTIPPTVSITAPANGSTVAGTISVTGTAADNVAVASVQVAVDSGAFTNASGTANWTFSLNTASLTNGAHTISAKAIDTSGNVSTVANISVNVSNSVPPPVITSVLTVPGTVGSAFSYQITATNNPTSFNATGLPAGLSINTSNGLISGTPTTTGTSSVTISAANAGGTGTATLTLTINNPAPGVPVITSTATATATVGSAFSYQITASNGPTSFNAAGLPPGLLVNTSNGLISGTPTAAGTSNVTISAANSSGIGSANLVLTIMPQAPVINSPTMASGTVSLAFSYQITATNSPTSFNATGLPAGLSVNTSNGLISGIPSVAGTSNVTIKATNAGGTGSAALALTIVQPAPPTVSIAPLSTTTVSGTISLTATASGGAGIVSVQFKLDGNNLGPPLTAAPYTLSWNSAQASVGTHILTAVASDAAGNMTASAPVTVSVVRSADATPGLRNTSVFPNPAVKQDPTIRAFLGQVSSVEITIFDGSGQVVHSASLGGAPTGIINGQYYYDYTWTGRKANGVYFAVIHGKAADGTIIRARAKFAVVQ